MYSFHEKSLENFVDNVEVFVDTEESDERENQHEK